MKKEFNPSHERASACLVIMPLVDIQPYESGHFKRVYEYIVKPACLKAGFKPELLDDTQRHKAVVIDSLRKVVNAEIVIFDLSTRDPDILYQLGIRQAFDLPTILIRDSLTNKTFEIQGIREIEYKENLRIDNVNRVIESIAESLVSMHVLKGSNVNSLVSLLGVRKGEVKDTVQVSSELTDLISAITNVKDHILKKGEVQPEVTAYNDSSNVATQVKKKTKKETGWVDKEGNVFQVGDIVTHSKFGLGIIMEVEPDGKLSIKFHSIGVKILHGGVEKLQLL